jgi:hypothetical protein
MPDEVPEVLGPWRWPVGSALRGELLGFVLV